MLFSEIVETSARVRETRSRTQKVAALAECLERVGPSEVGVAVALLAGAPRQERLGTGYAALEAAAMPPARPPPVLTLAQVDEAFEALAQTSGAGSQRDRQTTLRRLFGAATEPEQALLAGLILREVRQGALEGLLVEAVARAAGVPADAVRRAVMMAGDLPTVAAAALSGGLGALEGFGLEPFRPLRPMLAQPASSVAAALEPGGPVAVEHKLDGARIQVHRWGDRAEAYSRNLRLVSARIPQILERVLALDLSSIVVDGEAIALDHESRPLPFQVTMARFGTDLSGGEIPEGPRLQGFFFDCLHLDGVDLIERPARERFAALRSALPADLLVERVEVETAAEAEAFFSAALAAGQEGVVVKDLDAPYAAGRRGAAWRKVKPAHTLDLVVLAAEWGSGRRRGLLSNLHLGARDTESGGFVMLGKTFKGLTDEMLAWQTERFLALETRRKGRVVVVRPEVVVEVAFDGVQASSRYPGGMALRFARVKGFRTDKGPDEADTVEEVRAIHRGGGG